MLESQKIFIKIEQKLEANTITVSFSIKYTQIGSMLTIFLRIIQIYL